MNPVDNDDGNEYFCINISHDEIERSFFAGEIILSHIIKTFHFLSLAAYISRTKTSPIMINSIS